MFSWLQFLRCLACHWLHKTVGWEGWWCPERCRILAGVTWALLCVRHPAKPASGRSDWACMVYPGFVDGIECTSPWVA